MNRIERAFDDIRADDALIEKTTAYLQKERARRGAGKGFRPLRLAGVLTAFLILTAGIFGYRGFYSSAAAYVSLDVNPSVELTLNRMDRVVNAAAYNTEGEALLQGVRIIGMPYEKAVSSLLAEMKVQGYFADDARVTMTVQTSDSSKERALCDTLRQAAGGAEVFPITQEVHENARGNHMSAAKYLAIQELMQVDDTATLEECSDATLHQIRQRTRACREGHPDSGEPSGKENHKNRKGQGGGHGHNGR